MANKRSLLLASAVISVVAIGGVLLLWRPFKVARYEGKSIREWAMQAYAGDTNAAQVVKALGSNAVPALVRMLAARDGAMRVAAWSAAGALPRPLRIRVVQKINPPDAIKARQAGVLCLGKLGAAAQAACPTLVRALGDSDPGVSRGAAQAVLLIGPPSVPALIRGLLASEQTIRRESACLLGQLSTDAAPAIPALIPLLRDNQDSIRYAAALSLVQIGTLTPAGDAIPSYSASRAAASALMLRLAIDHSLHPFLDPIRDLARDKDATARRQAMEILGMLRLASDDAVELLAAGAADPDERVRLAACNALWQNPPKSPLAVPALVRCLGDESPSVREWAAKAVSRYGQAAQAALPQLRTLEHDTNAAVREAAKAGLAKMTP